MADSHRKTLTGTVFLLCGCTAPPTAELLDIQVSSTSTPEIDSFCASELCDPAEVGFTVVLNNDPFLPPDARVDILQYRIDYSLTDDEGAMPFFAAPVEVAITKEVPTSWSVVAAGNEQRIWVYDRYGGAITPCTATLSIAGYDHNGALVEKSATFDVTFVNLTDGGSTSDTGLEG